MLRLLPLAEQARHAPSQSASRHLLHHLLKSAELLDQRVDVLQSGPGPMGDATPSCCVEYVRIAALPGSHRSNDGLDSLEISSINRVLSLLGVAAHARNHLDAVSYTHLRAH